MKKICFVTGWYSVPYFSALGTKLQSYMDVSFIAQDSYTHKYLLQHKQKVYKRTQKFTFSNAFNNTYENTVKMDALFTSKGFGNHNFWLKYYSRKAFSFEKWIRNIWKENSPDIVVIWNGMWHYEKIVEKIALEKNITKIFIENGYFPKTAHIDPVGINAKAEIVYRANEDLLTNYDKGELLNFLEESRNSFSELKRYSQESDLTNSLTFSRFLFFIIELIIHDLPFIGLEFLSKFIILIKSKKKKCLLQSKTPLPKNYIFLPLQVTTDSQLILNSPWIKTSHDLITLIEETFNKINPDLKLVIKEHPMEDPNVSFKDLSKKFPKIYWASSYSLEELIKNAQLVVNINSSVGFQSLLFGKSVICLGNALYTRNGLAYSCHKKEDLADKCKQALENKPNMMLVGQFAKTLYEDYCVQYTRGAIQKSDIDAMAKRIVNLTS